MDCPRPRHRVARDEEAEKISNQVPHGIRGIAAQDLPGPLKTSTHSP